MFSTNTHEQSHTTKQLTASRPVDVGFGGDGPQLPFGKDPQRPTVEVDFSKLKKLAADEVSSSSKVRTPAPDARQGDASPAAKARKQTHFAVMGPVGQSLEGVNLVAGAEIGRGSYKHAVELSVFDAKSEGKTPSKQMVVLISNDDRKYLQQDQNLALDLVRHEHYRQIQTKAPGLAAEYLGLVAAKGVERERPVFGHAFERMEGTLKQLVPTSEKPEPTWQGHKVMSGDILAAGALIAKRYTEANAAGFSYLDPKPENFGVHLAAPADAQSQDGSMLGRMKQAATGFLQKLKIVGSGQEALRKVPLVSDVKFIDLDAFRIRKHDENRDKDGIEFNMPFVPPLAATVLKSGKRDIQGFHDAMRDERSAVWVASAVMMTMSTGMYPQEKALDRQLERERKEGLFDHIEPKWYWEHERQTWMGLRRTGRFDDEFTALDQQVKDGKMPAGMATLIKDGLSNRVASLDEFQARAKRELKAMGMAKPKGL